jgi:hypothetical protein
MGGKARQALLTKEERKANAVAAVKKRWDNARKRLKRAA